MARMKDLFMERQLLFQKLWDQNLVAREAEGLFLDADTEGMLYVQAEDEFMVGNIITMDDVERYVAERLPETCW